MKVFLETPTESRGIKRAYNALIRYAPSEIEVVDDEKQADLVILHIIGRLQGNTKRIEALQKRDQRFAMIQYCLRSTMNPHTSQWIDLWSEAEVVWSYFDLLALCAEDGVIGNFTLYCCPLGSDASKFKQLSQNKEFMIATCSKHALSESVRECAFAVKRVGAKMFHLGHELRRGSDIVCASGMSDEKLAEWYSKCKYVSGLRRTEGFEFPVIEGLLCGARPIVFDRAHYRQWYDDFAVFIPENGRDEVIESLVRVFEGEYQPVSEVEKQLVRERFNWESIIKGFWERILK